jgi:hypothetical protein
MTTEITTTVITDSAGNKSVLTFAGNCQRNCDAVATRMLTRDAMAWELYSRDMTMNPRDCYEQADFFLAEMERQKGEVKG